MCGIAGIIHFNGDPVEHSPLEQACAALRHRGPDDAGLWIDSQGRGPVGLAATRLAVLDPSPAGHQPMQRHAGRFILVYNGEVYNYRSLRDELTAAGERFETQCDTEVVLAACTRWGINALSRFNGMWALAFFDSHTRSGFLARDRFGIKPLFYTVSSTGFTFASELQALTPLGRFDRAVNEQALVQHLQFGYIAGPDTIYRGARRLQPGHYLEFTSSSTCQPVTYYEPPIGRQAQGALNYSAACVQVRRAFAEAVGCRRVADVPIGVLLSGGLDSSIIAAHLSAALGRPVETFTVGYAGQQTYDETKYARIVSSRFGTQHHELILSQSDILAAIPPILDRLGEPVGDSSIIPTALLCRFARQFVTVALSGDGGDELFGGYWRYLGHSALRAYQRIPALMRRHLVEPALRAFGTGKSNRLTNRARQWRKLLRCQDADPLTRHIAWSRILAPDAAGIFNRDGHSAAADRRTLELARQLTQGMDEGDPLNRILLFDLRHQLPADMLQKVDLAGMMHSLEVRVPFLDPQVVALATALPSAFKIDGGQRKRILVDAYRGHLPDEILDRSKQGFEVPIGEFLRGPLRPMFQDTVTRQAVESFGLLSFPAVERVYREHLERRAEHADVLFALLTLCWWRRTKAH